uniref:AIG1-type G domain-containing protein n=1 Tax=Amphiprion ocellaris TaxID=80972 RepID=A0A3Q1BI79_AMPOC
MVILCLWSASGFFQALLGPEFRRHSIIVFTHSDSLKEAELHPSVFLSRAPDWLRALADEAGGGISKPLLMSFILYFQVLNY